MKQYDLSGLRAIFAVFLETSRKRRGFERSEVAEKMGIDEEIIEQWETGKRNIDLVELCAFCQAIGLPFEKSIGFIEAVFQLLFSDTDTHPSK